MRKILPKRTITRERTPRFVYLTGFLAYIFWFGWGYILLFTPPDKLGNQILFLTALFFALLFTLTFLFYEVLNFLKKPKPEEMFSQFSRWAFFISAFISLGGAMKLVGIANPLNLTLFGLILLLTELQLSRR